MDGAAFAKRQIHILQQYFSLHIAQNACPSTDSRHTTTKTVRYRANINSPRHTANLCRVPMDRKVGSVAVGQGYAAPVAGRTSFAFEDVALGAKYRFITPGEDDWFPQVAFYPELPTWIYSRRLKIHDFLEKVSKNVVM
jgi:hypothetical protein